MRDYNVKKLIKLTLDMIWFKVTLRMGLHIPSRPVDKFQSVRIAVFLLTYLLLLNNLVKVILIRRWAVSHFNVDR